MRALLSRVPGGPDSLQIETVPDPKISPGQILISIKACGVNFPDLLLIQDLYQVKAPRPFSPGTEIAGIVEDVGIDVKGFEKGDRVVGRCGWGGMAEKIAIDSDRCSPIPGTMPFEHAAAFLFTYATSYYALRTRGRLESGETVLVLGAAGGVGIAAIQIAKALGARVIAAVSSENKLEFARQHGADDGLVYRTALDSDVEKRGLSKNLKSLIGPAGVDVVLDPVGGPLSEIALRCIAEGGRFLVLGFTAGIPSMPMSLPLLKSCDILGINWRTFILSQSKESATNQKALFDLYEQRRIAPVITETFQLDRGGEAIARLMDRAAMGKIVVTT